MLPLPHNTRQCIPQGNNGYEHSSLVISCFSQTDTSSKGEPVHTIGLGQQDAPLSGPLCQKKRLEELLKQAHNDVMLFF